MKASGNKILLLLFLLAFCLFAAGCTKEEKTDADIACELYREGKYPEAEQYFIKAVEAAPDVKALQLGHAYNLLLMNRNDKALAEFESVKDAFDDADTATAIRGVLLDLYTQKDDWEKAADICEELSKLAENSDKRENFELEAGEWRVKLYRKNADYDALEKELRNLIAVKTYACDEYYELYALSMSKGQKQERLALADEIAAYTTGHSSYVKDYKPVLAVLFDAADVAEYTEWSRKPDDYFALAEDFIAVAEESSLSENDLLKYKVIIAERRGKLELAYNLLGVYLNHCPEDTKAVKEMDYLGNRLGLK